ncbi:putative two-component sensor histidine kinase [Bradyrhizobium sp. ORS 375]|uniref:sensor histidine kinase n=1 Tax=Bradyrhizobium sp. (strain ORS 375) TaxID=566679 RepID=UPI0002409B9D|nr:sensor histidine kinase [Bradyrhizobium sp. ORS 375]CCD91652.1 putative two-component sensor histidine kinase [Bradyrhizobium sp. ORS 375]
MWTLPRWDLKYRLTLRIGLVSALCFAAICAYVLFDIDHTAHVRNQRIAEITARTLQLQQNKLHWVNSPPAGFPELDAVAAAAMVPGLCIAYRTIDGAVQQRICSGAEALAEHPPAAFASVYAWLFDPSRAATQPVQFRDRQTGEALAWLTADVMTADAWRELSRLLPVLGTALLLLCVLAHAAMARALRPTRLIRAGLERIAARDLSARLPPFDLAELSAIRDAFNQLADGLQTALAERSDLTRRLIALEDDERRHLARELHDEFGQSLAAIRALAASVRHSAARDCPDVVGECDTIALTATRMMETLRGTLVRLRPPDIDELGLAASLEGLIAGWNRRQHGLPRFEIRLSDGIDRVPDGVATHIYRIAQEALTNAVKHAGATRVQLQLALGPTPGHGASTMTLEVGDDGTANEAGSRSGFGLLGMRERALSLGGEMSFAAGAQGGSQLRIVIPLVASPQSETATERAA